VCGWQEGVGSDPANKRRGLFDGKLQHERRTLYLGLLTETRRAENITRKYKMHIY
jgi:hypothetical protein